jgi:uncharacterized membrane protein YjfL (UPF0719 family)
MLYVRAVTKPIETEAERDRAARRALFIEGTPVVVLGLVALPLGSQPASTGTGKALFISVTALFVVAVVVVMYRAFRRADEYQRKIQLESMAVGFAAVLVALQIAGLLAASGIGELQQSFQLIIIGGILTWQGVADLRTRLAR